MCFSQAQSLMIATVGFGLSAWSWMILKNRQLATGVFFFFLMELLQFFQYSFIDQCDHPMNKLLTVVGFAHICAQPFFTHLLSVSVTTNVKLIEQAKVVRKLAVLAGVALFCSWIFSGFQTTPPTIYCPTRDWVRAQYVTDQDELAMMYPSQTHPPASLFKTETGPWQGLCTYRGEKHLAWSIPMMDPTYFSPSTFIHSFFMFAPYLIGDWMDVFQGIFLFATGPLLSTYITTNLQEQASIWCFHSIAQIALVIIIVTIKKWKNDMLFKKIQ